MEDKKCSKCGETKAIKFFYKKSRSVDGHNPVCSVCLKGRRLVRIAAYKSGALKHVSVRSKVCSSCAQALSVDMFARSNATADGYSYECKSCRRNYYLKRELDLASGIRTPDLSVTEKFCTGCGETKRAEEFYKNKRSRTGLAHRCAACQRSEATAYRSKDKDRARSADKAWLDKNGWGVSGSSREHYPARYRARVLLKKFGITVEKYNEILEAQSGVCAICGFVCSSGKSLAVDHDHSTGAIRGLLCSHCNLTLGYMKDSPLRLRAAAAYLEMNCVGPKEI